MALDESVGGVVVCDKARLGVLSPPSPRAGVKCPSSLVSDTPR